MSPTALTTLARIAQHCDGISQLADSLRSEVDPQDIADIKQGLIFIRPVTHHPRPLIQHHHQAHLPLYRSGKDAAAADRTLIET